MASAPSDSASSLPEWKGTAPASGAPSPRRSSSRQTLGLVAIVVVVLVVLAVFVWAFVLPRTHHPSSNGSTGTVLMPSGTSYAVFADQSSAVAFQLSGGGTISGAFTTTYGVSAFVMTPTEYFDYLHNASIGGYDWTSGQVAQETTTTFSVSLPAGGWEFAFIDVKSQATDVLITSNVVVSS